MISSVCAGACGSPKTDITSTNTEGTGDYDVVNAAAGDSFAADVCVANPGRVDEIAERLVHQLVSHGYRTITLNFYGPTGPVGRVEWSPAESRRLPDVQPTHSVPCRTTETHRVDRTG
jgi:hypothetical protein